MGYYSGSIKLDFEGTNCEKQMMEELLQMMEPEAEEEWTLPLDEEFDFYPVTALLGSLEEGDDGEYYIPFGVPDYTLAPKLFAALFPDSQFHYSIILEYSVTSDDTPYLTAVYEENKLMMRDSYLYGSGDEEKIAEICRKMIETDSEAREKYEQFLEDADCEEDINWFFLLDELVDDSYETMASLYDYRKVLPSRNKEYESSFFKDDDLQEYLVGEQIKKHDMSIVEYIQQFSFTEEQLQKFIKIAAESNFTDFTALIKRNQTEL